MTSASFAGVGAGYSGVIAARVWEVLSAEGHARPPVAAGGGMEPVVLKGGGSHGGRMIKAVR